MFIWYRRIPCKIHKTRSKGYIELVWTDHFYNLVRKYIKQNGFTKRDELFKHHTEWKKLQVYLHFSDIHTGNFKIW